MTDRKYQLVIFDWDGTIIDSQSHIIHCMKLAIADAELPVPEDASIRHIIGLSLDGAIQSLFPSLESSRIEHVADRYREHFFASEEYPSPLFEGVEQTIRDLHASGYYLAVATGKSRRGLDIALERTGLGRFIHISRCADETRSKPHPLMLEEILTDLDLTPLQAVMVGDTSYDVDMAGNINMHSIAVTYGMHDRAHLANSHPTYFVDSIAQVANYV